MDNQEPMMLGSPVGHVSPSNTSLHQTPGNQFLPGYLMGDPSVATTPVLGRTMSGGQSHSAYANSPVFGSFTPRSSPPNNALSPGNKFNQMMRSRLHGNASMSGKEKGGGPPVSSLLDDTSQAYPSPGLNVTTSGARTGVTDLLGRSGVGHYHDRTPRAQQTMTTPRRILQSADGTAMRSAQTPPSPAQLDPFYNQGEFLTTSSEIDETWVTIFGFPPSASSYILQQFSRCGVILSHHSAPGDGNWMHIHFESKLQARKALSKSGKIFPGNLMIGVTPCIDVKVMSNGREDLDAANQSQQLDMMTITHSPATPSVPPGIGMAAGTPRSGVSTPKPCTIRPLTAAYNAAASGSRVSNDVRTPQKTNGIITKAMDYIFG